MNYNEDLINVENNLSKVASTVESNLTGKITADVSTINTNIDDAETAILAAIGETNALITTKTDAIFEDLDNVQKGVDAIEEKLEKMDGKLDDILEYVEIESTSTIDTAALGDLMYDYIQDYAANNNGTYPTQEQRVEWVINYLVTEGYAIQ